MTITDDMVSVVFRSGAFVDAIVPGKLRAPPHLYPTFINAKQVANGARPIVRMFRKGGKDYDAYRESIRCSWVQANGFTWAAVDRPLACAVLTCHRPADQTRRRIAKQSEGVEWRVVSPDSDNSMKTILDSLQGLAFENDRQVALQLCGKINLSWAKPFIWFRLGELAPFRLSQLPPAVLSHLGEPDTLFR